MKKLIRGGVALLALMGGYALAETTDGVLLGGTVATTLAIEATDTAGAAALDLDGEGTSGEHIVKVADVFMTTNNEQGLTLSLSGGNLVSGIGGGTPIAFSVLTVADAAAAPLTGAAWMSGSTTDASGVAGNHPRDLYIKYTTAVLQDPDSYSGEIELTVADNAFGG